MKKLITLLLTNLFFVSLFAQNLGDASQNSDSEKIYINPEQIKFYNNQIFVLIDDNLELADRIESDTKGLYITEIQTGISISFYWKCPHPDCGYEKNSPFSNCCKKCGRRYNDPNS